MPIFYVDANGTFAGEFRADSAEDVLDHVAGNLGFSSWEALVAEGGGEDKVKVNQVDTEALVRTVEARIEHTIVEDSRGDGVAFIHDQSVPSYDALAQRIGKRIWDFPVNDKKVLH